MSIEAAAGSTLAASGLPVVNQALEPASVRHGSAAMQKAYQSALAFEQVLVEQLSKSLATAGGLGEESSGEGESGSEEGGAQASGLSSMLPQALSSGVMNAGGLGIAAQMAQQLQSGEGARASATAAVSPSSGGTSS